VHVAIQRGDELSTFDRMIIVPAAKSRTTGLLNMCNRLQLTICCRSDTSHKVRDRAALRPHVACFPSRESAGVKNMCTDYYPCTWPSSVLATSIRLKRAPVDFREP
jgi:hypothetical protein